MFFRYKDNKYHLLSMVPNIHIRHNNIVVNNKKQKKVVKAIYFYAYTITLKTDHPYIHYASDLHNVKNTIRQINIP